MKLTTITTMASLGLCLFGATTASAFEFTTGSHAGTSHTVYLDPWIQIIMPDHYDKLQLAATKVNANSSAMRFTLANDNDVIQALNNGESEAGLTSDAVKLCGSPACATLWRVGTTLIETDAYFDINKAWTLTNLKTDNVAYNPSVYRPLLNTAIHEFTHTLGMAHENDFFQVMGNAWNVVSTNGSRTQTTISEDTSAGLRQQYGPRAWQNEDLSLYHWERSGATGAYSNHGRTDISSANGGLIGQLIGTDEPVYLVSAGDEIKVEQTAENRGSNSHTVSISWYVSDNALVTSADTLLEVGSITLGVNTPFTFKRQVALPATLVSGERYWVGAIIDSADIVSEQNEANNAIYIAELSIQ